MSTTDALLAALTELDEYHRGLDRQEVATCKHSHRPGGTYSVSELRIGILHAIERIEMWNGGELLAVGHVVRSLPPTSRDTLP